MPGSSSDLTDLPIPVRPGEVPALDRALDILEALARHTAGLTLTEISQSLALPKNAVFRITNVLAARGYLTRVGDERRFRLTPRFLGLGQPAGGDRPLTEVALAPMRRLRDTTRETVQLGVRSGPGGVVIEALDGLLPLRIVVDRGLRFPLHNNAPGKILLAFAPPTERDELIRSLDLVASTSRTITEPDALARECDRVQARGYSTDLAQADEGIHCVAAPIFGRHGDLAATVWISGPARRMLRETFPESGRQVRAAADEITRLFQV
ncbi:MAG: transcriptional regulator, IclR family [Gemmataceae bacterium]|nr:transcriptional regulator, IclR family [Gemmataceae bacterium]